MEISMTTFEDVLDTSNFPFLSVNLVFQHLYFIYLILSFVILGSRVTDWIVEQEFVAMKVENSAMCCSANLRVKQLLMSKMLPNFNTR